VLIQRGFVVDGTGAPGHTADILLDGGRVAAVGSIDANGAQVVDARGCVVTPGFIDIHSHGDFTLLAFPSARSAVRQGVTTVVIGNCGGGVAPVEPEHDFRRTAFGYSSDWGIDVDWRTFPEYLDRFRRIAVNVVALVPHGALRNAVMGLTAREPTSAELTHMGELLDEALQSGAAGLSSGLEYQPGCFAQPGEIEALAGAVANRGGFYATHMRNRAERFAAATEEALLVTRRTGVRLQLSHVAPRPYAPRRQTARAFELFEKARADGLPIWVDTFPETWGPGTLCDLFPTEVMQGPPAEVLRRLRNPSVRKQIHSYFESGENFLVRAGGYDQIFIASSPAKPEARGKSLDDLARDAGGSVADACCDLLIGTGSQFMAVAIRHVYAREEDVQRVLSLDFASLGSDGVVTSGEDADCAYPWSASTYGYAARTLEHYVREVGLLTLEDAVRKLAALPADAAGLADHGYLRPGAAADVVVLDADRVTDRTTPELCARHPTGIRDVFVNGVRVLADGAATTARPGRVLGRW
jgi:N-acyl-D-amino-acid deacylase